MRAAAPGRAYADRAGQPDSARRDDDLRRAAGVPDAGTALLIVTVAAPTNGVNTSRTSSPSMGEPTASSSSSAAVNTPVVLGSLDGSTAAIRKVAEAPVQIPASYVGPMGSGDGSGPLKQRARTRPTDRTRHPPPQDPLPGTPDLQAQPPTRTCPTITPDPKRSRPTSRSARTAHPQARPQWTIRSRPRTESSPPTRFRSRACHGPGRYPAPVEHEHHHAAGHNPTRAHVTARADLTLQHQNRAEVLVDGPEPVVRPVGTRHT